MPDLKSAEDVARTFWGVADTDESAIGREDLADLIRADRAATLRWAADRLVLPVGVMKYGATDREQREMETCQSNAAGLRLMAEEIENENG